MKSRSPCPNRSGAVTTNSARDDSSMSGQQHAPYQLNNRSAPAETVKNIFIVIQRVSQAGISVPKIKGQAQVSVALDCTRISYVARCSSGVAFRGCRRPKWWRALRSPSPR